MNDLPEPRSKRDNSFDSFGVYQRVVALFGTKWAGRVRILLVLA